MGTGADDPDKRDVALDDLIGRVYDVALDPSRYEDLLDTWEAVLGSGDGPQATNLWTNHPLVLGHIDRADRMLDRLADEPLSDAGAQALEHFGRIPAVLISEHLTVRAANIPARDSLSLHPGDSLSNLAIDPDDRTVLISHIRKILSQPDAPPSIYRVRRDEADQFLILQLRRVVLPDGEITVAAATSDLRWPKGMSRILREAFDLTKAEVEIIRLLLECAGAKDIADRRGRSLATVRTQIKTILSKTETNSQVELLRLTMSLMEIADKTMREEHTPRHGDSHETTLAPVPVQTIRAADGRRLDYLVLGHPKGRPVLLMHMKFGFIRWTVQAETLADAQNIRLIVPVRAGFGQSDPLPRKCDYGDQTARDILAVLDAEGVTALPVITLGTDVIFMPSLDRLRPGLVRAVIACAGLLPLRTREQFERMHKWHRFIQVGAKHTPHVLPFLVKAGFHLARRIGKPAFVQAVFGKSRADMDTFSDPEVFEAMIAGSHICLSDKHSAHLPFIHQTMFEHDPRHVRDLALLSQKIPLHYLNGMDDPVMHPVSLAELKPDYPAISFTMYPDAGQLLHFRHWRDVIGLVSDHL